MTFKSHMDAALDEARQAAARGEVPVGAVLVDPTGRIVARAGNRTRELSDPTAHAEILAIRAACAAAKSERLPGPCALRSRSNPARCAPQPSPPRASLGSTSARPIPSPAAWRMVLRVFTHPQCHHVPEIYDGIAAAESEALLKRFFQERRAP